MREGELTHYMVTRSLNIFTRPDQSNCLRCLENPSNQSHRGRYREFERPRHALQQENQSIDLTVSQNRRSAMNPFSKIDC